MSIIGRGWIFKVVLSVFLITPSLQ